MNAINNVVLLETQGVADCCNCIRKSNCPVSSHMLSSELDMNRAEVRNRTTYKNQNVFAVGEKFDAIYVVRSGFFRSYIIDRDGELQVTGFFLPGEIFSVEGIEGSRYNYNVNSLERGNICKIPMSLLLDVAARDDRSSNRLKVTMSLLEIMSRLISRDQKLIFTLGKLNAKQRFASFLLDLCHRMKRSGFSDSDLRLWMTRADIASYLGLAVETVSRLFTAFQRHGILRVNRRSLQIYDRDVLEAIVNEEYANVAMLDKAG